MIQPIELKLELPMKVGNGTISTTTKVWEILQASYEGDLLKVKSLVDECRDLIYSQYNYAPPIHFAVREGHVELVKYLLENGAHDPNYKFYPFQERLQTVANDRGYFEIEQLLNEYANDTGKQKYKGDTGEILYNRIPLELEFETAVSNNDLKRVKEILIEYPDFALDESFCWSEGILLFPAKHNNREMIDLLLGCGAKVPGLLKWAQYYYFERLDGAVYMMEKRMNPNTKSWQRVTLLHDMAQKGSIDKAKLLLEYGADLNSLDEEYKSTPLGLAARWGNVEMVEFLLLHGAEINKSGASWSTPLSWARKKQHHKIETILINAGAK